MFSQVQQALDSLTAALNGIETAPTGELRRTLGLAKQLRSRVELLETRAASTVAQRERHGDGGAGLLNQVGGRSRSDAARNVRLDTELAELPGARAGVADGEITLANAAKLANAARKTSPDAVEGDPELVQMAKTLPPDEFAQAAQRWTIRHQSAEDLAAQHRRNRRNRNVRFWNGEDGSVQMRGSFDAETGARIQQRLRQQAELLRQADRRRQARQHEHRHGDGSPSGSGTTDDAAPNGDPPDSVVAAHGGGRTRDQRMADALDTLLAASSATTQPEHDPTCTGETDGADRHGPGHTGKADNSDHPRPGRTEVSDNSDRPELRSGVAPMISMGAKSAEIIVRADFAALTGSPGGLAEICGVGPIPPGTLGRLACNSDVWIEIFGNELTPLYEAVASRAPSAAQRRALIARDGACIGCGEPPGDCEAHHIKPCQRGGKTRLDNLVLVCWRCHDLIHDHNWQVNCRGDRYGLAPPDPTHPTEPVPQRKPKRHVPQSTSPPKSTSAPQTSRPASGTAKPPPTPADATRLWDDPAA